MLRVAPVASVAYFVQLDPCQEPFRGVDVTPAGDVVLLAAAESCSVGSRSASASSP